MIDTGVVKNQTDFSRKLVISRVRVTHILNLLKLDSSTINELEKLEVLMDGRKITEREERG